MKMLDVYVVFDMEPSVDTELIQKCINVYLTAKLKCNVHVYQNITTLLKEKMDFKQHDIIKRGLSCFSEAFNLLKLKSTNNCWFIYISTGKISGFNDNVSLILLNKNPSIKECSYSITKKTFNVLREFSKDGKLEELKLLTKALTEVIHTTKTIKYK